MCCWLCCVTEERLFNVSEPPASSENGGDGGICLTGASGGLRGAGAGKVSVAEERKPCQGQLEQVVAKGTWDTVTRAPSSPPAWHTLQAPGPRSRLKVLEGPTQLVRSPTVSALPACARPLDGAAGTPWTGQLFAGKAREPGIPERRQTSNHPLGGHVWVRGDSRETKKHCSEPLSSKSKCPCCHCCYCKSGCSRWGDGLTEGTEKNAHFLCSMIVLEFPHFLL